MEEPKRLSPSRSELERILRDAVRNTGAAPAVPDDKPDVIYAEPMQTVPRPAPTVLPQTPSCANPVAPAKPLPEMPTADHVARAIIAAAKETGDDPLTVGHVHGRKFRHYAMHALVHCFPGHPRMVYARLVMAPGRPDKFFDNSKVVITAMIPGTNRRRALWWSEAAYDRVIKAIEEPKA